MAKQAPDTDKGRELNQRWNVLLNPVTFYEWRWEFEIASLVIKLPTVVM